MFACNGHPDARKQCDKLFFLLLRHDPIPCGQQLREREHGYEKGVSGNPETPTINRSLLLVGDIHLLLGKFRKFVHWPMLTRTKIDVAAEPQIA